MREPETQTPAGWADAIKRSWAQGAGRTLELAKVVCAAKASLARGEWTRLWKTGGLPFSKRKGEMLAVIATKMGGLNAQTFARLPRGWSVLYQLAHLQPANVEQLVATAAIHPSLTLWAAKELVARTLGSQTSEARRVKVEQRLARFKQFVDETCARWSAAERHLALRTLEGLVAAIAATCPPSSVLCPPFSPLTSSLFQLPLRAVP